MEWLELKIDTSPSGLDAVTALLEQQGGSPIDWTLPADATLVS